MIYFSYKVEDYVEGLFEKGKPCVSMGLRLRLSAFALNCAWPGEAKHDKPAYRQAGILRSLGKAIGSGVAKRESIWRRRAASCR